MFLPYMFITYLPTLYFIVLRNDETRVYDYSFSYNECVHTISWMLYGLYVDIRRTTHQNVFKIKT